MQINKSLTAEQQNQLLKTLQARFQKNIHRHKNIEWAKVQAKLKGNNQKFWSLNEMEKTGGEPDLIDYNKKTDQYTFYDCAPESPKERRSTCYDREAQEARKLHKPKNNAIDMATDIGVEILNEDQYRELQKLENFDTKTSSCLKTPPEIRKLGGAIFADFRFNQIFVYHNGVQSYYAARGFRGMLKV